MRHQMQSYALSVLAVPDTWDARKLFDLATMETHPNLQARCGSHDMVIHS
jgi:hypothetical protein